MVRVDSSDRRRIREALPWSLPFYPCLRGVQESPVETEPTGQATRLTTSAPQIPRILRLLKANPERAEKMVGPPYRPKSPFAVGTTCPGIKALECGQPGARSGWAVLGHNHGLRSGHGKRNWGHCPIAEGSEHGQGPNARYLGFVLVATLRLRRLSRLAYEGRLALVLTGLRETSHRCNPERAENGGPSREYETGAVMAWNEQPGPKATFSGQPAMGTT